MGFIAQRNAFAPSPRSAVSATRPTWSVTYKASTSPGYWLEGTTSPVSSPPAARGTAVSAAMSSPWVGKSPTRALRDTDVQTRTDSRAICSGWTCGLLNACPCGGEHVLRTPDLETRRRGIRQPVRRRCPRDSAKLRLADLRAGHGVALELGARNRAVLEVRTVERDGGVGGATERDEHGQRRHHVGVRELDPELAVHVISLADWLAALTPAGATSCGAGHLAPRTRTVTTRETPAVNGYAPSAGSFARNR